MSRDNTTYVQVFFVFFCSLFKTNEKTHKKKYFFKIVSSSSQKKQKKKEKIDFFKATQTKNASAQKREEKDFCARFVFLYYHHFCELDGRAHIASSKGERFEPRENAEHGAVWRRRERFRGLRLLKNHHIRLLGISKRRHQCAIESTYNRNRKRLKKWRRNESRKSWWCVVLLLFSRGENVVRFFSGVGVVADGSRRVARARSRISRRL